MLRYNSIRHFKSYDKHDVLIFPALGIITVFCFGFTAMQPSSNSPVQPKATTSQKTSPAAAPVKSTLSTTKAADVPAQPLQVQTPAAPATSESQAAPNTATAAPTPVTATPQPTATTLTATPQPAVSPQRATTSALNQNLIDQVRKTTQNLIKSVIPASPR